jgi:hypothetical protein
MSDFTLRSPARLARIAGWLYLAIIVLGICGELVVRGALVVPRDPAATLERIAHAQSLWRAGVAGDLLMHVLDIPVMVIFYLLLRPVNHGLALLATLLNLVQTAVLAVNKLTLLVPILLVENPAYVQALPEVQRQALSYLAINAHAYGFGIGLVFFGFTCLVSGHLIARSGFLPKVLGVLFQIAGLSYLANSFALLLAPSLAAALFPAVLLPAFVGELALCLWLIVKGVDERRWEQRLSGVAT